MKYVFEGEDLSNVLRENEIRIKRGTLKVYPLDEETPEDPVDDPKEVEVPQDAKNVGVTDTKTPKKKTKK
jgi:hypothetical protein